MAVLFIAGAIGFALLILLPFVFFTTFAASFLWVWGVGGYYLLKWLNKKEIPGIHVPFSSGSLGSLNEYTRGEQEHEAETNEVGKTRVEGEKDDLKEDHIADTERKRAKHGNDKGTKETKTQEKKSGVAGHTQTVTNGVSKAANGGADTLGSTGDIKKTTDGVTKKLPGDPARKLDAAPGVGQVKGLTGL